MCVFGISIKKFRMMILDMAVSRFGCLLSFKRDSAIANGAIQYSCRVSGIITILINTQWNIYIQWSIHVRCLCIIDIHGMIIKYVLRDGGLVLRTVLLV